MEHVLFVVSPAKDRERGLAPLLSHKLFDVTNGVSDVSQKWLRSVPAHPER